MAEIKDFSMERSFRRPVRETLERMCCDSLQFMWENALLCPRDEWHDGEMPDGRIWHARTLTGFRVVRQFWFLKRDQVLYRCPFCQTELITPLGYTDGENWLSINIERIGAGIPMIEVSRAELERQLSYTKSRNRAGWPPKD